MAIIVYDVTSQKSFDSTIRWANEVKKEAQKYREKEPLLVLAGNKDDLEDERVINTQEGEIRAKEVGATFFEVTATSFDSVKKMFDYVQNFLVPSKEAVPISNRAVVNKVFVPEDFEIEIAKDPDDINSVPPAKALMPSSPSLSQEMSDDNGGDKKSKKKRSIFGCCSC